MPTGRGGGTDYRVVKLKKQIAGIIFIANLASSVASSPSKADDLTLMSMTRQCINCDLSGRDMTRVDFSGTRLEGVNFTGATLIDANFSRVRIRNTNFSEANLQRANFSGSNIDMLNGLDLFPIIVAADFRGANFDGAEIVMGMRDTRLNGATFRGATMTFRGWRVDARNADFSQLRFPERARITIVSRVAGDINTIRSTMYVEDSDLRDSNFSEARFSGGRFLRSDLRGVTFTNAGLRRADFSGSDLRNANFQGATLHSANFSNANLSGANLRGADLTEATLQGAIMCETIAPDGTMLFIGCD